MSELTEKLWPSFVAEVGEQLEALELALVRGGDSDVHSLFRHFHTIKGGCAMMGFSAMEAVAHASEDLLDGVRRGERPLDTGLTDLLLQAIDGLKQQMQTAKETRADPPPQPVLVARLRAADIASAATSSMPVAAPPATETLPEIAGNARRFAAPCAAALPGVLQGDDEQIRALAAAAQEAGFAGIVRLCGRLSASPATRRATLADLLQRLQYLEETQDIDCATRTAGVQLLPDEEQTLRDAGRELDTVLQQLDPRQPTLAGSAARAALSAAGTMLTAAALLGLRKTVRLLLLCRQLLREIARGNLEVDDELADLLLIASGLPNELQQDLQEDPPYAAMADQLAEKLQEAANTVAGGRDHTALHAAIRSRIDIEQEVLDSLLPDATRQLLEAIDRHEQILEIEADLEATQDSGQEFVAWLAQSGTLISNQTVFHRESVGGTYRESTRLRFLAALPLPLAEIKRSLGEMDPLRRHFRLRLCERLDETRSSVATPGAAAPAATSATGGTLRIDSATLDQFVNRVGEMVTLRNMMSHALYADELTIRHRRAQGMLGNRTADRPLSNAELDELRALLTEFQQRNDRLAQTDLRIQGTLARMQEDVLALRVVPIGLVFNRLPRVVRDVSLAQNKQVNLEISGEDVRVDKSLVDVLIEPLMHLMRNAVDHGIETPAERRAGGKPETATLSLGAHQQGNMLVIEVTDDGRGLDTARIGQRALGMNVCDEAQLAAMSEREIHNFIFLPGFSTAEQVTEVSGRGVGMDVVKTRIAQTGGQVDVQSRAGAGSTFVLKLPLSVAIQSVILVAAGDRQLAIPERNVIEVLSIGADALQTVQGQACCLLRGATLPLYDLAVLLGDRPPARETRRELEVVVLTDGIYRIGVLVDRVLGRPEVFVRDIHPDIARLPGVGGASILGDGRVVIIVDCENLFELAVRNAQSLRSLLRAVS